MTEEIRAPRLNPWLSTIAGVGSRVLARLLGIVFVVYLARNQSPATFAAYSYLLVLATTIGTLTDAGVSAIAAREVARGSVSVATAYRGGAPVAAGAGVVAAFGVALIGLFDSGPGSAGLALAATGAFIVLNQFFGFQAELLRASGRPEREALLQTGGAVLQLVGGMAVVRAGGGVGDVLLMIAVKELVLVAAAQGSLPWPGRGERRRHWRRQLLRTGVWLGVATTAVAVMVRLPQIVLSNAAPAGQVGQFAAASRVLELSLTFTTILALALFPWVAQRVHHDAGFTARAGRLLVPGIAVTALATLAVVPAVPAIIELAFGDTYAAATEPAQILLFTAPLFVAIFAPWNVLVALGQERTVALWTSAGVLGAAAAAPFVVAHPTPSRAAVATLLTLSVTALGMCGAMLRAVARGDRSKALTVVD